MKAKQFVGEQKRILAEETGIKAKVLIDVMGTLEVPSKVFLASLLANLALRKSNRTELVEQGCAKMLIDAAISSTDLDLNRAVATALANLLISRNFLSDGT